MARRDASDLMARVLLVSVTAGRGGAEEYLLRLARGLSRRDWDVHAAVPAHARSLAGDLDVPLHMLAVPPAPPPAGRLAGYRRLALEARELARAQRASAADVALVSLAWPLDARGGIALRALRGRPTVLVFQLAGTPVHLNPAVRRAVARRLGTTVRAVAVSAQNGATLARMLGVRADRIDLIPNAVDLSAYELRGDRAALAAELDLPAAAPWVLNVGRLDAQKRQADLLAALAPDACLIVAGEGPLRGALQAQVRALGLQDRVRLPGRRDDVPRLLASADAFVLCSSHEGMPFAVLEAAAARLPIVATDVGGIRDVLTDGESGLIVPPGDPDSLAAALRRILADRALAARLAAAAHDRVARDFTLEDNHARVVALLEATAKARRRARRSIARSARRR